ncbi:hypothetical protein GCM10025883_26650 [Mobilicoccus caccae]|uniref:biotin carboxylase n=1 Tax=Mobilicoccus caccae TaxID=1859295 RepID=A0ABQ6ITC1_9MICO|nr:hypothetical protein GCM10025883_26650 [Mobilicoccus caccae]
MEVFAEEYLEHARHIEVQVARDRHGTAVTLGDRDCSLQRRHQKVVEFAPAVLEDAVREGMHASAVAVVDRAELVGLATVEYLWAPGSGRWTLLEVNPRLQVEHTITEEVTGADLVRGQIRLALGEDVAVAGLVAEPVPGRRSLQCRVTAEDVTATGWAPATGIVSDLVLPSGGGTRVDTHLTAGTEVTGDYDPLLAKIVVTTDGDPAGLLSRARAALAETSISGLPTTLPILRAILASVRLDGDDYDTGLLDRSLADLVELAKEHGDPSDTRPGADVDADRGDTARLVEQGWLVSRTGGTVTAVEVDEGQDVEAGGLLVLVEAMKMEQPITATAPGRIVELAVAVGDTLRAGDPVVRLEHDGDHDGDAGEGQDIDPADVRPDLAALLERRATTRDDARPSAVEKRRARGRTARENVADLCRGGDLVEYGTLAIAAQRRRRDHGDLVAKTPGDGMVAGLARLLGEEFADSSPEVAVIAYDYTVLAGTQGQINHAKTDRVLELAERRGYPVVIFAEGAGAPR